MTPQEYQMWLAQQNQQVQAPTAQQGLNQSNAGNPAGRQLANWHTVSDIAKDAAQNTAMIATGLATGTGLRSADGQGWINPMDVMKAQGAAGTPIGMLYNNAAGQGRENAILSAGSNEQAQFLRGSQDLASGATGRTAFAPASGAARTLAGSGSAALGNGAADASAAANIAQGMNPDVARLRAAADGTVPSAAQIQQQQGIGQAINSQASMAAAARGGNLAAAMRGAQAAGSNLQAQGIANNAALRANEMAAARGQLTQATGTQGQLFNQAGQINGALAGTQIGRDNAVLGGQVQMGGQILGSQQNGVANVGNASQMEQNRVGAAIGQDRQDINDQNNYLLQLNNQGLGFGAQNYGTDVNAGVQTRGQNLQLIGAAASGIGSTLAGLGTR